MIWRPLEASGRIAALTSHVIQVWVRAEHGADTRSCRRSKRSFDVSVLASFVVVLILRLVDLKGSNSPSGSETTESRSSSILLTSEPQKKTPGAGQAAFKALSASSDWLSPVT